MKRSATRYLNFTKRGIESLTVPGNGRLTVYDTHTKSLGLRVESSGARSFFWFRKVLGRPTFRAIGRFPACSLEQARGKAADHDAKLEKWKQNECEGPHPFEKPHGEPTFGELVEDYIARHIRVHAKRPERAEKEIRYSVHAHLGAWKSRKIGTIRRADVLKVHADLGRVHKFAANRVVELVRALFNFARQAELWSSDENPAACVKCFHEASRKRYLQPEELARLFSALRKMPADVKDFVNLSLWTGARKSDVLSMRWENISLTDNSWEVPDPKNEEPYVVALTPEAVAILKGRLSQNGDSPWIFPSRGKTGHLVNVKKPWRSLLNSAQIDNLRIHDLRRTLGSWQAATGASLPIIGKSLGHGEGSQATGVYARMDLDPVRKSVMTATRAMLAAASSTKSKSKKLKALPPALGAA